MSNLQSASFLTDDFTAPMGAMRQSNADQRLVAAVAAAVSGQDTAISQSVSEKFYRRHKDSLQTDHSHEGYDDGLVHSHGWARSDC